MIDVLFTNGPVLLSEGLVDGLALGVAAGRIAWIGPSAAAPAAGRTVDLAGRMLLPGFIDVQVNGGGGVLFNDQTDPSAIARIGAAHARFGTTGFLPTLISDRLDVLDAGIEAVDQAIAMGVPGVLGIHLEGPFINPKRRGVHQREHLAELSRELLPRLAAPHGGKTLVTLAPELVDPEWIAALTRMGVVVSAGHTEASVQQIAAAIDAGLTAFTHLFNAMPPLVNRNPGPVGAALADQTAWCGLIVDGFHVDPLVLRLALRCRPTDRFMLVTDAMPSVGSDADSFILHGEKITVNDGRCLDSSGTLAGTSLDMAGAVRNAMSLLGLDLPTAVAMASSNPAALLGIDGELGRIATGMRASLVVAASGMVVEETWIEGKQAFCAADRGLVL